MTYSNGASMTCLVAGRLAKVACNLMLNLTLQFISLFIHAFVFYWLIRLPGVLHDGRDSARPWVGCRRRRRGPNVDDGPRSQSTDDVLLQGSGSQRRRLRTSLSDGNLPNAGMLVLINIVINTHSTVSTVFFKGISQLLGDRTTCHTKMTPENKNHIITSVA